MSAGTLEGVSEQDDGTGLVSQVLEWVRTHPLRSGLVLPVCLWGDKGVGKTAMVNQFAAARGYGMSVYHPAHDHSGENVLGKGYRDAETGRTLFSPPGFLPSHSHAFNPKGVLLIDEINRATPQVIAGLFELIGEGSIAQSQYRLPQGWQIVAAANPDGGVYQVTTLDPALLDRMLHIWVSWDADRWARWAARVGLEEDIIQFAAANAHVVGATVNEMPDTFKLDPTPRALEYFATLYEPDMPEELLRTIAVGLLGRTTAETFLATPRGRERPLSGEQIVSGVWRRYLPRWKHDKPDLIAQSTSNLVTWMRARRPEFDAANAAIAYRAALAPALRSRLDAVLAERCPQWLDLMNRIESGQAGRD